MGSRNDTLQGGATVERDEPPQNVSTPAVADPHAAPITLAPQISCTSSVTDIGPPPDGGREAWLVVVACSFLLFVVFGFMNTTGQLQAYYLKNQLSDYSKSTVAWIGSIQNFVEFSFAIAAGRYFDIHGARVLCLTGLVLGVCSIVALAFCNEFYQIFLASFLFGISGAVVYSPATAVVAHWFLRRRGFAMGIVTMGAGFGSVIYPIMIEKLLAQLSYRDAMLIIAGFNFVLMLPSCIFMRSRLPPRRPPPLSHMKRPWHEVPYAFLVIGCMVIGFNIFSPYYHALSYAASNNLPPHIGDYSIAIAGAGSILGRLGGGWLGDHLGVWYTFGSIAPMSAIIMFATWTPPVGTAGTIVGLTLYGITSGAFFSLLGAAVAAISPVHEVGMRIGMLITMLAVPSLVGPVICAALITSGNDKFIYAGIFCGATFAVGGIITVIPQVRAKYRWARDHREDDKSARDNASIISAANQLDELIQGMDGSRAESPRDVAGKDIELQAQPQQKN